MVFLRLPFERGVKCASFGNNMVKFEDIRHHLVSSFNIHDFVLYYNGKQLHESQAVPEDGTIHVAFLLPGGKGGFGSMLRAIGAQIEKTTNREACRDLSGRRLRDINEEQRLKKWISKEAEREAEKVQRRKQRIERLKSQPKHNFVDFEYEKEISQLPERIDDALSEGIQKASKRPTEIGACSSQPSKKKRLWMDDFSESSDSDSQEVSSSSENGSNRDNNQTLKSEESEIDCSENSNLSEMKSVDVEEQKLAHDSCSSSEKEQILVQDIVEEHPSTSCSADEQCSSPTTEQKETMLDKNTNTVYKSTITEASTSIKETNSMKPSEIPVDSKDVSTSAADNVLNEDVDLLSFESVSELESLGLDRLKAALIARGLKCGGTLSDRAQRLWRIRGLQPSEYPSNLLAKKK
ncbi:replication stress response regulator SDE2 [Trichonephila clavata]|uniref:Replication stress response regulator SDE2 n=1 Tax=Trichonephila clavata TaxID=2740835 RepID=A0A8X6FKD3_TRICU|nr:replication stress response regulator SDE2 [Trichonephila clavata]